MKKSSLLILLLMFTICMTSITFADTVKYGSKGQQVKTVQNQLKNLGLYKGSADGLFGKITKAAVITFQRKSNIKADGIVGSVTAKYLANAATKVETPSRGEVDRNETTTVLTKDGSKDKKEYGEMLDWWTEASKIFYRGAVAKVTDVKTGTTYNIKRTYGTNHADCEALTLADAMIMKKLWGGTWSWTRRAVIIEIDGRKIAASSAGMPHAGLDNKPANVTVSGRSVNYGTGINLDTIKNNGMDGHFDVHFLNSRTHGTNRVDPKHQAMVKVAAGK